MEGFLLGRPWVRIAECLCFLAGLAIALWIATEIAVCACVPSVAGFVFICVPIVGVGMISYGLMQAGWKIAAVAATLLIACAALIVPWHPRQVFVRKVDTLTGHSLDQVQREMKSYTASPPTELEDSRYVPDELIARKPDLLVTYRWSRHWAYDSDLGQVFLRNGKVVGTRFLAD